MSYLRKLRRTREIYLQCRVESRTSRRFSAAQAAFRKLEYSKIENVHGYQDPSHLCHQNNLWFVTVVAVPKMTASIEQIADENPRFKICMDA